jgi:glycosyltransferase involved in cell wall biosynthesis
LGIEVERIHSGPSRAQIKLMALRYAIGGFGVPHSTEAVLRSAPTRRLSARRLQRAMRERGVKSVIHTGILDVPMTSSMDGVRHYLYCDDDWSLSLPYRPDGKRYTDSSVEAFASYDRRAMAQVEHVFTFSQNLRNHMISHYGLSADRVTAVGCGMGRIEPYHGPKYYDSGHLLFVAKHIFVQKGGLLLLDAFRIARSKMPHLTLTIVGDSRSRSYVGDTPGIELRDHLPWSELQELYRRSALLVQPMLNDPWGQVYVEALASRTPVLGLDRNGLPQITEGGRHGFLVPTADPEALATVLLDAMSDPERLARMGQSGQAHVLKNYTWDEVARRIAYDDAKASRPDLRVIVNG